MHFQLAYIKSENQFMLKSFGSEEEGRGKIMELSELAEHNIQGIIYPESLSDNQNVLTHLKEEVGHTPIRSEAELGLSIAQFESLEDERAKQISDRLVSSWTLQKNVSLLEELFKVLRHMHALWPNDRTAFFEELWNLLKINLGAAELRMVYNDLEKATKENERDKLVQILIEGNKTPVPRPGGEFAEKLMKHYEGSFTENFEIAEYDEAPGRVTILASINKSPIIIMASLFGISRLQKALMGTLFDGLQNTALSQ